MTVPLPHPNIEPPPGAQLDSAALGAIFAEIQRNFDALTLATPTSSRREVAGAVSSAGAPALGSGFTIAHPKTGFYVITFDTAFLAPPVVVANPGISEAASSCQVAQSATFVNIQPLDPAGVPVDAGFNFRASRA